ncbi:hypothetical protein [Lactococcus petauri]|uniref:hypothetical protein n=1 Tax=Lactococcus petauri TaxID=1940789 RepID=UPI00254E023D|nr:hypothetical protein [Lactococcus petauri]
MDEIKERIEQLEVDKLKLEENLNLYKTTKLLYTATAIFLIIFSSVPMIFSILIVNQHFWAYFIIAIILLGIGTILLVKPLIVVNHQNILSFFSKIKKRSSA